MTRRAIVLAASILSVAGLVGAQVQVGGIYDIGTGKVAFYAD